EWAADAPQPVRAALGARRDAPSHFAVPADATIRWTLSRLDADVPAPPPARAPLPRPPRPPHRLDLFPPGRRRPSAAVGPWLVDRDRERERPGPAASRRRAVASDRHTPPGA